jgi:hypothetical protein
MRPIRNALLVAATLHVVVGFSRPPGAGVPTLADRVDSLADALVGTRLALYPEIGTELGLPNAEHGRVTDNSLAAVRAAEARFDGLSAVAASKARAAFGASFDIRAFHDRVLEDGTIPLGLLRTKIERWIATAPKADSARP